MKIMKYSSKLIRDYLNGEDIQEYEIEQLENNPDFMTEVILVSGDKNMYEMCSDEVKGNYEFASFLINKFISDKKFINKVVMSYIENEKDIIKKNEMCIFLNNLSYQYDDMEEYRAVAHGIYNVQIIENKAVISSLEEEIKEDIGFGFCLILDEYPNSKIVHDFFAKKMVNDIISNMKLEILLHRIFKKVQVLDKTGINFFLLSLIREYDKYLAIHLENNLDFFNDYKKDIEFYKKRWDDYDKLLVEDTLIQFDILCEKVNEKFSYLLDAFLIYVINKLNLNYLFEKNEEYCLKKDLLSNIADEKNFDVFSLNDVENIFLLEVESLVKNIFFEGENEYMQSENKKFIKVNF